MSDQNTGDKFGTSLLRRPYARLVGALTLVAVLLVAVGCSNGPQAVQEEDPPVAVEVKPATRGDLRQIVLVSGELQALRDVYLAPTLGGSVKEVNAEPGQVVEAGAVVVALDDSDVALQVQQAEAALQAARAALRQAEEGARPEQLAQLQAAVDQAYANREQALRDYQRMDVLYREGAISKQMFEQAELGLTVAEKQYEQAKRQLEMAENGATESQKDAARAQVAQAEAAYRLASKRLDDMRLTAPFAGIVTMVNASEGQLLGPGNPVVRVVEMSRLKLTVGVGASVVNSLAAGDAVSVQVPVVAKSFEAAIKTVSPAADPRTKQYSVEIELPNSDLELKPGMLAISRKDGEYVFVVEDNVARERRISTGLDNGTEIAVLEGLSAGEKVVVRGQEFLSDGSQVEPGESEGGTTP